MGAKISVLGLIMSISPYLRSAMVRFPLAHSSPIIHQFYILCCFVANSLFFGTFSGKIILVQIWFAQENSLFACLCLMYTLDTSD